jgi:DNA invertase Pin-like site-specific DNA recombinase
MTKRVIRSYDDEFKSNAVSLYLSSGIMASLAQMERELVAERTRADLAAAKAQGRIGGRKRKMTKSKIESAKKLLASGTLPKDVASNLGVSIPTLYRWIPASSYA